MDGPVSPVPARIRGYFFCPFVVDISKRQLWRDNHNIALTAKTFDVLAFLIANRHRVVTKDEFFAHVWPDTIVLEANLVRQISLLRRALVQRADQHDFIVTIPGRGYQFVAEVEELTALPDALSEKAPVAAVLNTPADGTHIDSPPVMVEVAPSGGDSPSVGNESPTTLVRRLRDRRVVLVGAAALFFGLISLAWFLSQQDRESQQTPGLRKFTFDAAFPREPAWSPDGGSLAYTSDKSGNADIWVQSLDDPTPRQVTTSNAQDWQPHWSPVSDQIAFRSETDGGGLFIVPAAGGPPRRLTNFGHAPRWSPDGKLILFSDAIVRTGARHLFVVDTTGGTPREVAAEWTAKLRTQSAFDSFHAAWDPDGKHVSLWGRFHNPNWTFLTVSLADGTATEAPVSEAVRKQMDDQGLRLGNFDWSRSGRDLYFEGRLKDTRTLWRVSVDPATKAWLSGPDRLSPGTTDDINLALSPDGSRLAFSAQTTQTRVWSQPFDSATGQLRGAPEPLTPGNGHELDVNVSEDGTQLAYRAMRGEREEIWAYSLAERSERLLLASTTARRTTPLWSPDGKALLYARRSMDNQVAAHALAILPLLGGNERVLDIPNQMQFQPRDWARDGRAIVGSCRAASSDRLSTCVVAIGTGSIPTRMTVIASDPGLNLYCARFSPDQQWVSFLGISATDSAVSRVYVVPVAGGRWTAVTDGLSYDDKPSWAPDGRTLYFVSSRSGSLNIWGRHIDPSTGSPSGEAFPVTHYQSSRVRLSPELGQMEIAVSRDRLFLPISETTGAIWILDNLRR